MLAPNRLVVPDNIGDLLDHSLIQAPVPASRLNPKFCIDGHPEFLVRAEGEESYLDVREAIDSVYTMTEHGVNVLPSAVVAHRGLTYVVTLLVEGRSLNTMVEENPDEPTMTMVDTFLANSMHYVHTQARRRKRIAEDVTSIGQTMYGTTTHDPDPKLWLVDLPWSSGADEPTYRIPIEYGVKHTVEIEQQTSVRLQRTREALTAALAENPPIVLQERIQPMQNSLNTNVPYYSPDWG